MKDYLDPLFSLDLLIKNKNTSKDYLFTPLFDDLEEFLGIIETDQVDQYSKDNIYRQHPALLHHFPNPIEALHLMKNIGSNILFILDMKGQYLGALTSQSVLNYLYDHTDYHHTDVFVEISHSTIYFSLQEVVRIIESEGSEILNLWKMHNQDRVRLFLVVRTLDLRSVIRILEAKEYEFEFISPDGQRDDILEDRYHNFINYLNI